MKLRLNARDRIKRLKIPDSARAKHAELHAKIRQSLPKDGKEFGKSIEKKLTASQRIWSNVSIALFSDRALENVSHTSSIFLGLFMLFLTDLVLIFPTKVASLAPTALVNNFFVVLAGLLIANGVTYAAIRVIGSKTKFRVFFSTVNTALFMSLLVVAIPAALVMFAIFNTMISSKSVINMFFGIIPFYNYLVYGWASEVVSKLKGARSVIVGLVALLIILFLNLLLAEFMI